MLSTPLDPSVLAFAPLYLGPAGKWWIRPDTKVIKIKIKKDSRIVVEAYLGNIESFYWLGVI